MRILHNGFKLTLHLIIPSSTGTNNALKAKPADRIGGFCFIIALNCDIKLQHTAALNGVALRRSHFVRRRVSLPLSALVVV